MRIVLVGDLHLKPKRLKDVSEAWHKTVNWAKENGADLIVQAGDVFDKPNVCGREADVGTVYDAFLSPFKDYEARNLFLLPGNHDMGGPREKNALAPFEEKSWISVCNRPMVVNINDELAICAVPWVNRAQISARLIDMGMPTKQAGTRTLEAMQSIMTSLAQGVRATQREGKFVLFAGHLEVTGTTRQGGDKQANGLFEFSPKELAEVGADAYALAHIHVRQHVIGLPNENDGYLGTLCQLGHGEEGNETGFRFIDIEGGKIVKDTFVNNTSSPRYFTVGDLGEVDYDPEKDYVKLRGEIRPDRLPDRIKFEKIASAETVKRRTEEYLDANTPIQKLLEVWRDEVKCKVPLENLLEMAQKLADQIDAPEEAIGSLERIDRICLHNITSHEKTEVDLSDVSGVNGIEGPNGSGKTTFLESILIALYGHCPSRPSLKDIIRNREDVKDAMIEVDFVTDGKRLTARREFRRTPKTFAHDAYIYKTGDDTDKAKESPLAGPKVDNANNVASILVGDLKMVLTGIFSAQSEMDNIVNLDRKDRKEMFARLLGTVKFIRMSEKASDEAKGDNATLDAAMAQIESLKLDLANEKSDVEAIAELRAKVPDKRVAQEAAEADIASKQEALDKLSKMKSLRDEQIQKIEDIKRSMTSVRSEAEALGKEKVALQSLDVAPLEAEHERLISMQAKVEEAKRKIAERQAEASKIQVKASNLRVEAQKISNEAQKKHAALIQEESKRRADIAKESAEKRTGITDRINFVKGEIRTAKAALDEARRREALLSGFPDLEECKTCPLAQDGLQAQKRATEALETIATLEARLSKGESVLEEHDKKHQIILDRLGPMPSGVFEPPADVGRLEAEADALDEEAKGLLPPEDVQQKFNSALEEIKTLPKVEAQLKKAREAHVHIAQIDERIASKKERYQQLGAEMEKIQIDEEVDASPQKQALNDAKERLKIIKSDLENTVFEIGRAEAALEIHEKTRAKIDGLKKSAEANAKKVATLNALATAFGRDGIPQLIVDSTIPHFQDILSDLLTEFDGRWAMQIQSQKETQKGKLNETIDLLVDDGYGYRDIKTYSGGEKQLLKTITRIAFATLQAERSGRGLKVLVLDEATGAMDPDLAEQFVRMVGRLSRTFNQVFVVSHNDYVLATLPNRIIFSIEDDTTRTVMSNL